MTESAPLRADAQIRRTRLLAAASTLFVDEGLDVPMERIAREAGVGVGTLYRRFPDRTALLVEVAVDGLGRMRDRLLAAAQGGGPAWDTLVATIQQPDLAGMGLRGRLAQHPALATTVGADPRVRRLQGEVADALSRLVRAAQEEGSMRTDVGTGDVALLLYALGRRALPDSAPPEAGDRLRALVTEALSARSRSTLPSAPLDVADVWEPRGADPNGSGSTSQAT